MKKSIAAIILIASNVVQAQGIPVGGDVCNQLGDYALNAWQTYDKGATAEELFASAKRNAQGNANAEIIMLNVVGTAIKHDSAGNARRAVIRQFCD